MNPKINQQLGAVVSKDGISRDADEIKASLTQNPLIDAGVAPSHIVRPRDQKELEEIVELANREGLSLTVTSSAGRHTRGGIASSGDNILIDLASWKRIEHIDRRNRVCMIQPGVTYGELSEAVKEYGMTVPMPIAPRSGKSVIASVTDREPSTWPNKQWDWGDPVGSTEVIFGNGSAFRTGSAGGPGTLEAQRRSGGAQKFSGGPSQTDLHRVVQGSQGTMGIITWITVRAELLPTVQRPLLIGTETLDSLIPFVYEVQRPGLGEHIVILNRRALGMLMAGSDDGRLGDVDDSLPRYICLLNVAGFERMAKERVRYQERDIREIAGRHRLSPAPALGAVSAEALLEASTQPCGQLDWRHGLPGDCLSIFFLTTLDRTPPLVKVFYDTAARRGVAEGDIGVYIQPVVQNHSCHVEFMVPFNRDAKGEADRMRALEKEAVTGLVGAGAFFSRPYGASQDIVFRQHPVHYEMLKKVKDIFDPGRVLNKGKWGL
jgi:FAD/FMN-containing dehydrogenase